jgi:hypothetical protein
MFEASDFACKVLHKVRAMPEITIESAEQILVAHSMIDQFKTIGSKVISIIALSLSVGGVLAFSRARYCFLGV